MYIQALSAPIVQVPAQAPIVQVPAEAPVQVQVPAQAPVQVQVPAQAPIVQAPDQALAQIQAQVPFQIPAQVQAQLQALSDPKASFNWRGCACISGACCASPVLASGAIIIGATIAGSIITYYVLSATELVVFTVSVCAFILLDSFVSNPDFICCVEECEQCCADCNCSCKIPAAILGGIGSCFASCVAAWANHVCPNNEAKSECCGCGCCTNPPDFLCLCKSLSSISSVSIPPMYYDASVTNWKGEPVVARQEMN